MDAFRQISTLAGLLASATMVAGHGFVTNATLGDTDYTFYQPYTDPYTSPTPERVSRPIQGNGPVTDLTYTDIQCGGDTLNGVKGSSPANLTATVAAGSTVDLYWTEWPSSHVGPTITYMAKCDNDDCTTYMPGSDTVWFKVQEDGRDGTSDTWGATALMAGGSGSVSYTVPECIESGAYLVRHEIIALHSAGTEGGAQFYPGCHQIEVTGGSGASTPSDLVAFPGAYSADDAGILYNAYEASTYTVPGPALFSCSGSSSGSSSSGSSGSSSGSGSSAAVTSAAAATSAPSSTFATVTRSASSAAYAAVAAAQTTPSSYDDGSDDGSDDGCEPEETVTSTISASQPAETGSSSSSSSSGSTGSYSTGSDSSSSSSSSSSSDEGEDDGCDAEGEGEASATTGSSGGYTQAQPTGSASASDDGEDCTAEEEQAYARSLDSRYA